MSVQLDWSNLGFGYIKTPYRYTARYRDGKWDEGRLTDDDKIVISECAGVLQYAQTAFEGLKAYTTRDGKIVTFRPDLNAERMEQSAARLEMPVFPREKFLEAVDMVVAANRDYVPPYGSGATLYIRPFMFGSSEVIGVKPAKEYEFRMFCTPVGRVTSGSFAPSLGCVIAFAWADAAHAGAEAYVVKASRAELPARVTEPPFYKDGTARMKLK